ncbi:peptidase dimerization domain-containing protein [Paractinoplanes hotanensis]|uniref:Peptidase dimerization domain-containing protein n=1 Tax=Paractinoplanes hotanensis TaxID=2906497 RepID=A0ABT0YDY2_9ACTN|nr:peptidase dimerization domain-containing protein [Actinoplanes hotanensis]MCM4084265.1 peptidase dimerization domain-containing protein [Actinoplanes hotanensis]
MTIEGTDRRRVLKMFGLSATATTAAIAAADPVLAATLGYDERVGFDPVGYRAAAGLATSTPAKETALAWVAANSAALTGLSDRIWDFAELSLREWKSSLATAELLGRHGFRISWGAAGLPAAFVATYGSGGPVLGFNAEYDALPGLSQRRGVGQHDPLDYHYDAYGPTIGSGHGDAHNTLGAASVGAAIAVSKAIAAHGHRATVKVFGSTGEEQLVGKPYAVKAGVYDGLDAYLDWHPLNATTATWNTTSALISATFTFLGAAGHGGAPLGNKSGLDGALMLATMAEYLREKNVGPAGRFHYAIVNGGGAPNVTPDTCAIWFFVREGSPARARVLYDKIATAARAAAAASQTRLLHKFHTATWNSLGNRAGAELAHDNMRQIGPPQFTDADQALARQLQGALGKPQVGLPTTVAPLSPPASAFLGGPSTDSADVSWRTPTVFVLTAAFPPGVPHHNWAVTASAGSGIGHAATVASAKYLAATAIDLITQPDRLAALKDEFTARTEGAGWASLIPDGAQPPVYEPPASFLTATGQSWPPPGLTWPVERVVAHEQLGTLGPDLPPVT